MMVGIALFFLLLCELFGEILHRVLRVPIPGPVLGMLLLAGWYGLRGREPGKPMRDVSDGLLHWFGLLFVPVGVGIITKLQLIRTALLPIAVAVLLSTVLTFIATALLMQLLTRDRS